LESDGDFAAGDINLVWEINRFGFVYPLVRAYWRTFDERYAKLFWQFFESWFDGNLPETGVNWNVRTGISIRVMAWCFGLYGFGSKCGVDSGARAILARMIGCLVADESNIGYGTESKKQSRPQWKRWALDDWFTVPRVSPDSSRWGDVRRSVVRRQAKETRLSRWRLFTARDETIIVSCCMITSGPCDWETCSAKPSPMVFAADRPAGEFVLSDSG